MFRTRSLALLAGLVGIVGSASLAVAPAHASGIQIPDGKGDVVGLVKQKHGGYLLDVKVEAVRNGDVQASAFTYESDVEAGRNGFYRLEVDSGRRYTLVFSKPGFLTRTVPGVRVRDGREVEVDTVSLLPKPDPSRTAGSLVDNRITAAERGEVVVSVSTRATDRPVGEVSVKYGHREVGDARLRRTDEGTVTVSLDRLDRGTYPLKVYYGGAEGIESSKSREFKLTVEKPRRHGHGHGHGGRPQDLRTVVSVFRQSVARCVPGSAAH
jgi:hypothetical protein